MQNWLCIYILAWGVVATLQHIAICLPINNDHNIIIIVLQEAKLLQQSQDIATYEERVETKELEVISLQSDVKEREQELQQQRDERRTQEEQLQQELQSRGKMAKAEYLESVHSQQFDELIEARLELIEKDEEIRQQQTQTTAKGEPGADSLAIDGDYCSVMSS